MVSSATRPRIDDAAVWSALATVPDPEIPTVSMVDLGIIERVDVGDRILVEILPTFSGCPALDFMAGSVRDALAVFLLPVDVTVNRSTPWHSGRITPEGREKLRASGFAPPPLGNLLQLSTELPAHLTELEIDLADGLECPHCGSSDTRLDSLFGPTQCRALYYCRGCRQAFEQFKPV